MEVTKAEYDKLQERVSALEGMLLVVVREVGKSARSSHRRLKNVSDQKLKQFELFDEMAGELERATAAQVRV